MSKLASSISPGDQFVVHLGNRIACAAAQGPTAWGVWDQHRHHGPGGVVQLLATCPQQLPRALVRCHHSLGYRLRSGGLLSELLAERARQYPQPGSLFHHSLSVAFEVDYLRMAEYT